MKIRDDMRLHYAHYLQQQLKMNKRKLYWYFNVDHPHNCVFKKMPHVDEISFDDPKWSVDDFSGWDGPYATFGECKREQLKHFREIVRRIRQAKRP